MKTIMILNSLFLSLASAQQGSGTPDLVPVMNVLDTFWSIMGQVNFYASYIVYSIYCSVFVAGKQFP